MRVLFVIPVDDRPEHIQSALVKRGLDFFRDRIKPSRLEIVGVRKKSTFERCPDSLADHFQVEPATDTPDLEKYDAVLSLQTEHRGIWKPALKLRRRGLRTFLLPWNGLINELGGRPAVDLRDTYIFNQISCRTYDSEKFSYFPYTHQIHSSLFGDAYNELGFRCDLGGLENPNGAIAVFGGSTVYGTMVYPHENFPARLGSLLAERQPHPPSVLNFGVPSDVVLDEINNFILYCAKFRPKVVISYGGFNDLCRGIYGDARLLSAYEIAYADLHVAFADWVHNGASTGGEKVGFLPDVTPDQIIDSFVMRSLQFKAIVEAFGGTFIKVLQPLVWSKKLNPVEQHWIDVYLRTNGYSEAVKKLPFLYGPTRKKLQNAFEHFIDADAEFRKVAADKLYFADPCHLLPDGENELAAIILDFLQGRKLI